MKKIITQIKIDNVSFGAVVVILLDCRSASALGYVMCILSDKKVQKKGGKFNQIVFLLCVYFGIIMNHHSFQILTKKRER